jgi:hypothetical protein
LSRIRQIPAIAYPLASFGRNGEGSSREATSASTIVHEDATIDDTLDRRKSHHPQRYDFLFDTQM